MKEIKEAPLTEEDIIFILQLYKPSLTKIFQRAVDLSVDEKGFIRATTPTGGMNLEPIVNTSLRVVGLEELKKPVAIVKIVEEWWKVLTPQQRKALFYRYVDHDNVQGWPDYLDEEDFRIKYHTRSERDVAKLLGVSKTTVREIIARALKRLKKKEVNKWDLAVTLLIG